MSYKVGFRACEEYPRTRALLYPPDAQIPRWLRGSLYRTGPGKFEVPLVSGQGEYHCEHWFDGFALLHHFSIESDGIYYRNQYMAKGFERAQANPPGGSTPTVEDCCSALFKKCLSAFVHCHESVKLEPVGSAGADSISISVTVSRMPDDTMVLKADAPNLQQFDPATLLPKAIFQYAQYGEELSGTSSAAHEQFDVGTQEYFNFVLDITADSGPIFKLFSLTGKSMAPRIITNITDDPAYVHSFAMTEHYLIFPVFPFTWDIKALPTLKHAIDGLVWNKNGITKYHVVDRATGKTMVYQGPASFCFHTINAFEDESGDLIVDFSMYADPTIMHAVYVHPPPGHVQPSSFPVPFVQRLRFENPVTVGKLTGMAVHTISTSNRSLEMPRINPRYQMKRHRYVYGWNFFGDVGTGEQPMAEQIIKIDMETGISLIWKDKRNMFPSEPIFIARPGAIDEDDGVVLSIVLDTTVTPPVSFMLILDASNFNEVARACLPAALPYTFHGEFFAITY